MVLHGSHLKPKTSFQGSDGERKTIANEGTPPKFAKSAESIAFKEQLTILKPVCFGQKRSDSRFYPECVIDTTGIWHHTHVDWQNSRFLLSVTVELLNNESTQRYLVSSNGSSIGMNRVAA